MAKKRSIAKTAIISSAAGLMAVGIFYSLFHNITMASMTNSIGPQARFPYPTASLQPLNPHKPDTDHEATQSYLWSSVHFPTDDYDGQSQELGRKISDWVVRKIKN